MGADTIPARLFERAGTHGDLPAWYEKVDGAWQATSFAEVAAQVRTAARALVALGVEAGQRVAILAGNRSEWVVADLAAMAVGAVPAGVYETSSAEEVGWILAHASARVVFVEDAQQWAKVVDGPAALPALTWVVLMRGNEPVDHPLTLTWEGFLARAAAADDGVLSSRIQTIDPQQPATFIYTSGTTGPPKAAMLSHANLAWTASQASKVAELGPGDSSLSYLPLSHIAEQMFSVHAPITAGSSVYFVESRDLLLDNLKEVQPTVFFGVPRVWEKLFDGVNARLAQADGGQARVVGWAQAVGRAFHAQLNQGRTPGAWLRFKHSVATRLLYSRLKPLLGLGAARLCVSGAAPVSGHILEFLTGLDVVVHEVYGQSEGCGPTTFNTPGRTRLGTVGPAFPGVEVTLADDGEVLVRGPNVFLGYFDDPEATDAVLVDGVLRSGDLGELDDDGFLRITGRKKEIIITSGGKNVAPANIELALQQHELVSQAVVIGDQRNYLAALLSLNHDAVQRWAEQHGLTENHLHEHEDLKRLLQAHVDSINERLARVESVRRFAVLPRELSLEEGELTPTLKVKRRVVYARWHDAIERLYAEGSEEAAG